MIKKIAIAVDGSVNCNSAVRYAVSMFKSAPELHFILVHIQPSLSQYLTADAERKPKAYRALQTLMKGHHEASHQLLEKVREQMVFCDIPTERIEICSFIKNNSVAEDLIDECQAKSYDAVCVGRRGISYLQEMITGSVTTTLLEHSQITPVWVVAGDVPNSRVLLAADGSPNALRALDHYCFMFGGDPDAEIHIVHVKPRLQEYCEIVQDTEAVAAAEEVLLDSHLRCIDDFYAQALRILEKNGLNPGRLKFQTMENRFSTAGAILDAARKGGFGTIVLGRRGFRKSVFSGSVARKIVHKITNTAIWLVP